MRLCSDDWGIEEVGAVCQQLGMPPPSSGTVPAGGTYGGNVTYCKDERNRYSSLRDLGSSALLFTDRKGGKDRPDRRRRRNQRTVP